MLLWSLQSIYLSISLTSCVCVSVDMYYAYTLLINSIAFCYALFILFADAVSRRGWTC